MPKSKKDMGVFSIKMGGISSLQRKTEALFDSNRDIMELKRILEDEVKDLTLEQSDILHKFEKTDLKYEGRAKLATRLSVIRIKRRELKEWLKCNDGIFNFLESDKGLQLNNRLSNFLGVCRKTEADKVRRREAKERMTEKEEIANEN